MSLYASDQENVPPPSRGGAGRVRKPLGAAPSHAPVHAPAPPAPGTSHTPDAVRDASGGETCFEEYRARLRGWGRGGARRSAPAPLGRRGAPPSNPRPEAPPQSPPSALDEFFAPSPPPPAAAPARSPHAAPSPTINTKLAMDDVMAMFGGGGADEEEGEQREAQQEEEQQQQQHAPAALAAAPAPAPAFSVYCDDDEGDGDDDDDDGEDELGDMVGFAAPAQLDTILETSRECSTSAVLDQVVDPFDRAARQQILDAALTSLGGLHLEDDDDAPFDVDAVLTLAEKNFDLGERMFNVEWALSESRDGGEAVLLLTDLDDDDQVAMKLSREPLLWEYSIQHKLRRAVRGGPDAADFLLARELHIFRDCCCLLSDVGEGRTLDDVLRALEPAEPLALFYAVEALRVVGTLHRHGVLHCALSPAAFHVRKNDGEEDGGEEWGDWNPARAAGWRRRGLSLAGFALAVDTEQYAPGTRFATARPPAGMPLGSAEASRPWTLAPDLRGLAAVMAALAGGRARGWSCAAAWDDALAALASGRDGAVGEARTLLEEALAQPHLARQVRPMVCRVHLAVLQD